ncbi:MAG: crotonase/enoyl-CoA hydratase family protein [Thalassovita sp.]
MDQAERKPPNGTMRHLCRFPLAACLHRATLFPSSQREERMTKVLYEKTGRIARITLNRPEVMNAIDDELPHLLAAAVAQADADPGVHVMVLSGNGPAFCAGYDLTYYAEGNGNGQATQDMPWDPIKDYAFMWKNTQAFMSLFRALKPVICKVHGFAVAGGSDIALCSDLVFMEDTAKIGYMPARVWGCPTTAMWVYRLGPEKAKRMMFTGDKITGREAEDMGLILKATPVADLDNAVEEMADRMASVPINQLVMQKMVINQAVEQTGLMNTQRLATIFDGITRHSPEGINFKNRAEDVGWKQAVHERDTGTYDWTQNRPINAPK